MRRRTLFGEQMDERRAPRLPSPGRFSTPVHGLDGLLRTHKLGGICFLPPTKRMHEYADGASLGPQWGGEMVAAGAGGDPRMRRYSPKFVSNPAVQGPNKVKGDSSH